jgi:hypothetical protein
MALEDELKKFANRPITQKEVEEVKSKYTLQPDVTVAVEEAQAEPTTPMQQPMQSTQPLKAPANTPTTSTQMPAIKEVATEYLSPATNIQNIRNVKNQMESLKKPSEFTDYLPYLAPLAVEALFGGGEAGGVSAEISGKALLGDEAKKEANLKSLEDKLLDMKTLKTTTKFDAPSAAELGKMERFLMAQKQKEEQKKKDIEIAAGARFQQKLEQDKVYQNYKNQMVQGQRALEFLAQGRGVSDAGLRTVFAKGIFGDVGNIAVQEAAAISGSPMLFQRYETLRDMWFKGTRFGDQDRADLIEIASLVRDKAPGVLQKYAQQKAQAEQQISGIDVSKVASALSRDSVTNEVMVKVLYNNRIKSIPIRQFPEAVRKYKATLYTGKE